MDPQQHPHWNLLTNTVLALLILMILGDLVFPELLEEHIGKENMEVSELVFSLIILTDITISFVKATDKKTFLKKNIIKIIAVFPWGAVFRGLAILRVEAELPMLAELAAAERTAVAGRGFRLVTKAKELFERV
ncbi:MAG: hypothetical protein ACLFUZ_02995 [Candidatus Micrarchaeia archaeon]